MKKEKNIEDILTERIVNRITCSPRSLKIPSWSHGTMYVKFGWFKKVKIWCTSISVEIAERPVSFKNEKAIREIVLNTKLTLALKKTN